MNLPNQNMQMPDEMSSQGINGMAGVPQQQQALAQPQQEMGQYAGDEGEDQEQEEGQDQQTSLRAMLESVNIAEHLDDAELNKIGGHVRSGFEQDLQSRREWELNVDEWTKLAQQTKEQKSYPWPRASNVKYPLLATAAMQFAARAYPSLVPSDGQVVKGRVIGKDPDGSKLEKAKRIGMFMSYQIMDEMPGWEEDMDRLLLMVSIVGVMFKKTYWDPVCKYNISRLIMPKNMVVNYWATCMEEAERVSEIIEMSPRILKERQLSKQFLDIDLGEPASTWNQNAMHPNVPPADDTTPYQIIEQHTFLDLDEDGYEEPYIVTFHRQSGKVLRIAARFDEKGLKFDEEGELIKIEPICYYTKFDFIPAPDGSFYGVGFGTLLGPINESVNTLINQLIDAGTLTNLQSGFIGKGLRLRMGETRFQPGEWKAVNATGDDLKKQIVPLPAKEPSNVLFQLMGALITSGKELASVAEIFTGKMPGQNTPATTTMASIEQGMKVFTAVYKRIFRALDCEFQKLYDLNATYLDYNTYAAVVDTQVSPDDFDRTDYDVCPAADPQAVSQSEKLMKAQALMQLLQSAGPILNPVEIVKRTLDAMEIPAWEEVLNPQVAQTGEMPPQPPDPKTIELQQKGQFEQQKLQLKAQDQAFKQQQAQQSQQTQQAMAAQSQAQEAQMQQAAAAAQAQQDYHNNQAKIVQQQQAHSQQMSQQEMAHQQRLRQTEEAHQQKMEVAKSQARANSRNGNETSSRKKSSKH